MTRVRTLTLALVALFALSVAVSSASAATKIEFWQGGKAITTNKKFTSTSGESVLKAGFGSVKCKTDTNAGETTSPTHVSVQVKFKECKDSLGRTCTGTNPVPEKTGEIWTVTLTGWLIFLDPPTNTKRGLFLKAKTGNVFSQWECGSEKFEVKSTEVLAAEPSENSCVAGELKPQENKEVESGELSFKESAGKQEFRKFEYEAKKVICELESKHGSGAFEKGTETSLDKITWEPAGTKVEVHIA